MISKLLDNPYMVFVAGAVVGRMLVTGESPMQAASGLLNSLQGALQSRSGPPVVQMNGAGYQGGKAKQLVNFFPG